MCIADKAIARRTFFKQTVVDSGVVSSTALGSDPRRLAIAISTDFAQYALSLKDTTNISASIYTCRGGVGPPSVVLRLEDYGITLMGELWLVIQSVGSSLVVVTEILADREVDLLIQKEVR